MINVHIVTSITTHTLCPLSLHTHRAATSTARTRHSVQSERTRRQPGALVAVVGSSLSYFRYFFLLAVAAKMGTTYKLRPWVRMPFSAARRALTRRREREEPPV